MAFSADRKDTVRRNGAFGELWEQVVEGRDVLCTGTSSGIANFGSLGLPLQNSDEEPSCILQMGVYPHAFDVVSATCLLPKREKATNHRSSASFSASSLAGGHWLLMNLAF